MCIGTVATMHAPCVHSALSCKHHSSSQLLAEQANPVSSGPATVDHKVRAGIRNTQVASQIHRLQTCAPHMACSTVMSVQITLSTALAGLTGQITWHHQSHFQEASHATPPNPHYDYSALPKPHPRTVASHGTHKTTPAARPHGATTTYSISQITWHRHNRCQVPSLPGPQPCHADGSPTHGPSNSLVPI